MRLILVLCLVFTAQWTLAQPQSLTPAMYKTLNEVQEQITNQEYAKAEAQLLKLEDDLEPSFGLALAYQLHGQLYLVQENNESALKFFRKALDLNVLEPAQEAGIATTTAQILMSLERAKEAYNELAPRLTRILEQEEQDRKSRRMDSRRSNAELQYVQPHSMVALATACQLQKQYKKSIPWLRRALSRSESPKESWLLMLMVALYQERQLEATAQVLSDLQRINPSKEEYWMQQAGIYQQLEKPALALRSLELGYAGGYLKTPAHQLQLVQLLMNQELPERAGRLLSELLKTKAIELNERNWRLLASAWQQSRERSLAIAALQEASEHMDDGSLLFRAAQLQLQNGHYANGLKQAEQALKKGLNDKDRANTLVIAANAAYELTDYRTARRYFQQALGFADTAATAKSWLDYLGTLEEYQSVAIEGALN